MTVVPILEVALGVALGMIITFEIYNNKFEFGVMKQRLEWMQKDTQKIQDMLEKTLDVEEEQK